MKQHWQRRLPVYQYHQRPDCQSTITWNQVCVLSRHKLWQFFFSKTLSTMDITPTCCYEKIYNFPEKSELPKFILPVKINWLIVFCSFWGGNTKFAEIRAGSLSCLAASPLNFVLAATPHTLVLQCEPARRLSTPFHWSLTNQNGFDAVLKIETLHILRSATQTCGTFFREKNV